MNTTRDPIVREVPGISAVHDHPRGVVRPRKSAVMSGPRDRVEEPVPQVPSAAMTYILAVTVSDNQIELYVEIHSPFENRLRPKMSKVFDGQTTVRVVPAVRSTRVRLRDDVAGQPLGDQDLRAVRRAIGRRLDRAHVGRQLHVEGFGGREPSLATSKACARSPIQAVTRMERPSGENVRASTLVIGSGVTRTTLNHRRWPRTAPRHPGPGPARTRSSCRRWNRRERNPPRGRRRDARRGRCRIEGHDVAVLREGDQPVAGDTERRRKLAVVVTRRRQGRRR